MAPPHELGPAENRSRITVSVGDTLTVRLPEQRMAGFRWQPEVDDAALSLVDDRYEPPGSRPGAPGTRLFTFDVLRAGNTPLRLVSRRSWETGSSQEYVVDLTAETGPGG
jgi:inhibitor of cysteine peptidase